MKKTSKLIGLHEYYDEIAGKKIKTINPPLYNGSTILFESYEDFLQANAGLYPGICYGTDRLPTQRAFEEALAEFEGGALCRAFQSGISAIIHTLLAFTRSGDQILVCENSYFPTLNFCRKILTQYQVEIALIPATVGADIEHYISENTRLIFLESPGSNTFEIQDIPAITQIAKAKNIITVLDNTWATPLYLQPFALGIDISIQSVTKYISGHSDVLLGTVTLNQQYAEEFAKFYRIMEVYASSDDCYQALRGLKTLAVRLRQHEENALTLARWLETLDFVDKVIHPALETHPQHTLWKRDFSGSSGLFAFTFKQDYSHEQLAVFINALKLFGIGYSWGGFKSLITAGRYPRKAGIVDANKTVIRLNIGLEDYDDIQQDLTQGFECLGMRL